MNGTPHELDTGTSAGWTDEVGRLLKERIVETRYAIKTLHPYEDYSEVKKEVGYHQTILKRLIQDLAQIEHGR